VSNHANIRECVDALELEVTRLRDHLVQAANLAFLSFHGMRGIQATPKRRIGSRAFGNAGSARAEPDDARPSKRI
jgi:hypothetical protein